MSDVGINPLSRTLHALVDSAKERLWVASPYVGSWNAVECVLGSNWRKLDARLLTDKDSGILARDTFEVFAEIRPVRSLLGLHAKLYIADERVLLTSANLTAAAFTRRHEAGLVLGGSNAQQLIEMYEHLWNIAETTDVRSMSFTRPQNGDVDERFGRRGLPRLYVLPDAPDPSSKGLVVFRDYEYFLETYQKFSQVYLQCGGRDLPHQPLYFETDKFLNFLFHNERVGTPSHSYKHKRHRPLTDAQRACEIKRYRTIYRRTGFNEASHHPKIRHQIRGLLSKSRVRQLTTAEIEKVAGSLNCFGFALARTNFLKRNSPDSIRKSWFDLIHGSGSVKSRMNNCKMELPRFGRAAIQETLGYYYPDRYPLRNANVNAGLRFLGYDVGD